MKAWYELASDRSHAGREPAAPINVSSGTSPPRTAPVRDLTPGPGLVPPPPAWQTPAPAAAGLALPALGVFSLPRTRTLKRQLRLITPDAWRSPAAHLPGLGRAAKRMRGEAV